MLATKTIMVYGDDSIINQIKDESGVGTSVKFLTIDEIAFLRVVIKNIIENDSYSYLMNVPAYYISAYMNNSMTYANVQDERRQFVSLSV